MRTERQALVRVIGRGSRQQVVGGGVNRGEGSERSGEPVVREGEGDRNGGGGGVTEGGSQGAVYLGDVIVKGEEERVTEVR